MSEALRRRGMSGYFDLVPWADPYIASLVEKLQNEGGRLLSRGTSARAECSPPSFSTFDNPSRDSSRTSRRIHPVRRLD